MRVRFPHTLLVYKLERSITLTSGTENLTEFYYERLSDTSNPGLVLAQFFGNVSGKSANRQTVMMFNRLIKLFGRFTTYFAIVDVSLMDNVNFDNPFPLLAYFCKKRLEAKEVHSGQAVENLDAKLNKIGKMIKEIGKTELKVRALDD